MSGPLVTATSPISRSALTDDDAVHVGTPILRLLSDERLVALVRGGQYAAFDVLVTRYEARLLRFSRGIVRSREDAEDVVQDAFAAAFKAMLADQRPIHVRPWLYRIARNRSLNEVRRVKPHAVDSLDDHRGDHGCSAADRVDRREELRELLQDIKRLPDAQRRALVLREMEGLSYQQLALALEKTVPGVKSLLFRARPGLAKAVEARSLACDTARGELPDVAEGNRQAVSPVVHRHLRVCERCACARHPRTRRRASHPRFASPASDCIAPRPIARRCRTSPQTSNIALTATA